MISNGPRTTRVQQGVALNTCPAASSNRYDHSTFNPHSKPRPRAGVRGLRRSPETMIQNFATFRSSLPDDSIEADGEIVVPCGRGLMDLIRTAFQRSGFDASEIDQHSHYGWSFDASGAEGHFWLMIQYPEPWLLMIQDSRAIWKRAFAGKAA